MPALEGVRRLILGSVQSNAGDLTSARSHYEAAIDEGVRQGDVHASAFASYELGMLICKNATTLQVPYLSRQANHAVFAAIKQAPAACILEKEGARSKQMIEGDDGVIFTTYKVQGALVFLNRI